MTRDTVLGLVQATTTAATFAARLGLHLTEVAAAQARAQAEGRPFAPADVRPLLLSARGKLDQALAAIEAAEARD